MVDEKFKKERFDVIILAGQSNAEGYGRGPVTKEYVPNDDILWLCDDGNPVIVEENGEGILKMKSPADSLIEVADEPIDENGKIGKFALPFSEKYAERYLDKGRKLLIIKAAVGGSGFARRQWGLNNPLHERMIKLIKEAISLNPENRIVAFLWHQGEHDSFENADWDSELRYKTHKKNLTDMINDVYAQAGYDYIPFIAGGFCDEWYLQNQPQCDAVLKAIREVCDEFGGKFVETDGLLSNNEKNADGDVIHFCRESSHILGEKYFEKYVEIRELI